MCGHNSGMSSASPKQGKIFCIKYVCKHLVLRYIPAVCWSQSFRFLSVGDTLKPLCLQIQLKMNRHFTNTFWCIGEVYMNFIFDLFWRRHSWNFSKHFRYILYVYKSFQVSASVLDTSSVYFRYNQCVFYIHTGCQVSASLWWIFVLESQEIQQYTPTDSKISVTVTVIQTCAFELKKI